MKPTKELKTRIKKDNAYSILKLCTVPLRRKLTHALGQLASDSNDTRTALALYSYARAHEHARTQRLWAWCERNLLTFSDCKYSMKSWNIKETDMHTA